jgi:hypothetical protein
LVVTGKGKTWRGWGPYLKELPGAPPRVLLLQMWVYPPTEPPPARMIPLPPPPEGGPAPAHDDPDLEVVRSEYVVRGHALDAFDEVWIRRGGVIVAKLKVPR